MQTVMIKETQKKIFVDEQFMSMFRSILISPVFSVRNKTKMINFVEENVSIYKKVECKGEPLNLTTDLPLFVFINKKKNLTSDFNVKFKINEFYDFMDKKADDVSGKKNTSNRNNKRLTNLLNSMKKLKMMQFFIQDKLGNQIGTSLIGDFFYTKATRTIEVEIKPIFMRFYEIDCNNIQNIDFEIYNAINGEYAKGLYLYYISNNMLDVNTVSIETLKKRFLSEDMEDKKFNDEIKKANEELKSILFVTHYKKVYCEMNARKLTHFEYSIDVANKKQIVTKERVKEKKLAEPKALKTTIKDKIYFNESLKKFTMNPEAA